MQTKSRQENVAIRNLANQGYSIFPSDMASVSSTGVPAKKKRLLGARSKTGLHYGVSIPLHAANGVLANLELYLSAFKQGISFAVMLNIS